MDLDYILKFKQLIDEDFKHQKKVGYYASILNISGYLLNQKALSIEGKSAKQIIDGIVMDKAKVKLIQSNDSVKEIAFSLGFYDPTYFYKFFLKYAGDTPLKFRENFKYNL